MGYELLIKEKDWVLSSSTFAGNFVDKYAHYQSSSWNMPIHFKRRV